MVNSDCAPHILVDLEITMQLSRLRFQRKYPYSLNCCLYTPFALKEKKNQKLEKKS